MVRNSQEHAGMDDQLNLINAAADRRREDLPRRPEVRPL